MPSRHATALVAALMTACGGPPAPTSQEPVAPAPPVEPAATITAVDVLDRLGVLASDDLRGRDTPSPGLEAAARYIADEFARLGLEPAGGDDGYMQRYPFIVAAPDGAPADTAYPPNVAGVLRGSDERLRDTYLVVSAHFDHLGTGRAVDGDSIYNGADDNASGTSAMLELAEAFAAMPTPPARSLLFLAVSGEESGLLGSKHFATHPTVPIERIVANINIDMIGRNSPDSIVVIGQEYSSLGPLVRETAAAHAGLGIAVGPDPWPTQRFFFRSDHYNFVKQGVPALFFFAGVHEDYHLPSDEIEEIDADKVARVTRLVFHTARAIVEDTLPPTWHPGALDEVRALRR